MTWIKTKHIFNNDEYELYNVETGFYIYIAENEKYNQNGIYHGKTYDENGSHYGNCLYMGSLENCRKVFDKLSRKLGVTNEVSPTHAF